MREKNASNEEHHEPMVYEIRFKGHLDTKWVERFEGLSFAYESDGTTSLSGPVVDQAALHGFLRRVRDLGLPLVSIIQIDPKSKKERNS